MKLFMLIVSRDDIKEGIRLVFRLRICELPYLAGIGDLGGEREQGCGVRKENRYPAGKVSFIRLIK